MSAMTSTLDHEWDADVGLYGTACQHQGIHSALPQGMRVHALRDNARRAVELIASPEQTAQARGRQVLSNVLAFQDSISTSPTFGVWGYYAEEPPAQMVPADYNWADFIGLSLCQILHRHADRVDADLLAGMRNGLRKACMSIFRRNIHTGYTNIAVKGGVVCACAGELLDDVFLRSYGTQRMQDWVRDSLREGINEYNSPTYNLVALRAIENGLTMGPAGPFRTAAAQGYRLLWTSLAEHYHVPTGQIAGPFSRCYSDLLKGEVADLLRTAAAPGAMPGEHSCPDELREHFRTAVTAPVERVHAFQAARGFRAAVTGTTWMDDRACLGTVSRDTIWWQRRALIAYWQGEHGPVVAKMRVMKDNRDWASVEGHIRQRGPRALLGVNLLTNQGDHHPSLDRPGDGAFSLEQLRLRFELIGDGGRSEAQGDTLRLSAGSHALIIHPLTATWGNVQGTWSHGDDVTGAFVECCFTQTRQPVLPQTTEPLHLAAAVEVVPTTTAPSASPKWLHQDKDNTVIWPVTGMELSWPATAQTY